MTSETSERSEMRKKRPAAEEEDEGGGVFKRSKGEEMRKGGRVKRGERERTDKNGPVLVSLLKVGTGASNPKEDLQRRGPPGVPAECAKSKEQCSEDMGNLSQDGGPNNLSRGSKPQKVYPGISPKNNETGKSLVHRETKGRPAGSGRHVSWTIAEENTLVNIRNQHKYSTWYDTLKAWEAVAAKAGFAKRTQRALEVRYSYLQAQKRLIEENEPPERRVLILSAYDLGDEHIEQGSSERGENPTQTAQMNEDFITSPNADTEVVTSPGEENGKYSMNMVYGTYEQIRKGEVEGCGSGTKAGKGKNGTGKARRNDLDRKAAGSETSNGYNGTRC